MQLSKEEILENSKNEYAKSHHYIDWYNMWLNRGFNGDDTDAAALLAMKEYSSLRSRQLEEALEEVRRIYLYEVDEDGPKAGLTEIMLLWENINKLLTTVTT